MLLRAVAEAAKREMMARVLALCNLKPNADGAGVGAMHVGMVFVGESVNISWEPSFTFGLRGDEDAEAGTEVNPDEDLDEE